MNLFRLMRLSVAIVAFSMGPAYAATTQYDPDSAKRRTTATCQECDERQGVCLNVCVGDDQWCMIEIPDATPQKCAEIFRHCVKQCDLSHDRCKAKCQ